MLDPDTMRKAAGADWAELGRRYVEGTRPLTGQSPRFTDKLPHNFLYAGYIANALPRAKLVLVRRNPMDTCLGNFRQLFSLAAPNYDRGRLQRWKHFEPQLRELRVLLEAGGVTV